MMEVERREAGDCAHCGQEALLRCSGCRMVVYCGQDCQKAHRGEHKEDCRCWSHVSVSGKGHGLVARRQVLPGEVIIRERPLLTVTTPHTAKTLAKFVAELRQKVRALDEKKQEEFFSLSVGRPELCTRDRGETVMMGIFQCSSIPVREMDKLKGRDLGSALYTTSARLNHSCKPNVAWCVNSEKKMLEVRAARTIEAGEELSVCYIDPVNMAEDRRKLLMARYNFQCKCEVCGLEEEELKQNDKIRREILGLGNNMEDVYREQPVKAFRYAKMRLERIEKMGEEMMEILPQAYMDCYELCLVQKEEEIAQIFARRGSEAAKLLRGNNSLWSKINP